MITASEFARQYASTWAVLTPMSEEFVRHVNGVWCERMFAPVRSRVSRYRRALVNEVAFQIFAKEAQNRATERSLFVSQVAADAMLQEIVSDQRWARLGEAQQLNIYERHEISALVHRLRLFFLRDIDCGLQFNPLFYGCGIIDNSYGDVIKGKVLYEVKAGGRFFRSIDLRQLLIYSALNKQAGTYEFTDIGMYNPRIGIYYQAQLSEVCYEVSGRSAEELLSDIIERASGSDISR